MTMTMNKKYIITEREEKDSNDFLVNASVGTCGLCGTVIRGMGGNGYKEICKKCYDLVVSGKAVGCIKHQ